MCKKISKKARVSVKNIIKIIIKYPNLVAIIVSVISAIIVTQFLLVKESEIVMYQMLSPLLIDEKWKMIDKLIETALKNLSPGKILYNPPNEMKVGVKEIIEVRISKKFSEDLSVELKGRGVPQIENIKVGTFMKARLTGEDFDIKTLSHEEQLIPEDGFTYWEYYVTPLKSGIQILFLTVSLRIKIPNFTDEVKDYPVIAKKIKVKVSPIYSTKYFIKKHWAWIITVLIIPIIAWIIKKLRKSKNNN